MENQSKYLIDEWDGKHNKNMYLYLEIQFNQICKIIRIILGISDFLVKTRLIL